MKLPALECWACARPFEQSELAALGVLRSRELREGGPYYELRCPHCGYEIVAERNGAQHWFCFPPGDFGFFDRLLAASDRREEMRAREAWYAKREGFRSWFFKVLPWNLAEAKAAEQTSDPRKSTQRHRPEQQTRRSTQRARSWSRAEREAKRAEAAERARRAEERRQEEERRREEERQRPVPPAPMTLSEARKLLGVEEDADVNERKQAYRRLAMLYHPDKFAHLDSGFVALAEERFLNLKRAYELLERA